MTSVWPSFRRIHVETKKRLHYAAAADDNRLQDLLLLMTGVLIKRSVRVLRSQWLVSDGQRSDNSVDNWTKILL